MPARFEIIYHPDVASRDIRHLSGDIKLRIKKAIETKLVLAPHEFGAPLRRTLKGYWKLRAGDWRIIYKIVENTVVILRIGHRREIYERPHP